MLGGISHTQLPLCSDNLVSYCPAYAAPYHYGSSDYIFILSESPVSSHLALRFSASRYTFLFRLSSVLSQREFHRIREIFIGGRVVYHRRLHNRLCNLGIFYAWGCPAPTPLFLFYSSNSSIILSGMPWYSPYSTPNFFNSSNFAALHS